MCLPSTALVCLVGVGQEFVIGGMEPAEMHCVGTLGYLSCRSLDRHVRWYRYYFCFPDSFWLV